MSNEVSYTARTFSEIREQLLEFVRKYYPDEFSNFEDLSVEMMLLEMMSYVGDGIHFNIDDTYKNSFIQHTNSLDSAFRIAKSIGYKPKTNSIVLDKITFFQQIPRKSETVDGEVVPDETFCYVIKKGTRVSDFTGQFEYELIEDIDMKSYESIEIGELDEQTGEPETFVIEKKGIIRSGSRRTKNISVDEFRPNLRLFVDSNVAFVESVVDAEGNKWYEVDYLAQDTVFERIPSDHIEAYREIWGETPFYLRKSKVSRKFITDFMSNGDCFLQFGQGRDPENSEVSTVDYFDIIRKKELENLNVGDSFVLDNFFFSDSYGKVPVNTTLSIRYITSVGSEENASANTITNISNLLIDDRGNGQFINTLGCVNEENLTGAKTLDSLSELKFNVPAFYSAQKRCVTAKDYLLRVKSMPPEFGNIDKVFVEKNVDFQTLEQEGQTRLDSKSLNIYVLSRSSDNRLQKCNDLTKRNLKTYIEEFAMMGDRFNIIDPFVVNIRLIFEYYGRRGFNNEEIELNLARIAREHFDIRNWEINQPIVIEDVRRKMLEYEGVLNIPSIEVLNVFDTNKGYSGVRYDTSTSGSNYDRTKGIIYPPRDVAIFELRYPEDDIIFRHV